MTAPNLDVARALARAALEARLAACANIVPGLESHYWWQGRLETSTEVLVIFKTAKARLAELQALLLPLHPYQTAEWVAWRLEVGSAAYVRWALREIKPGAARPRRPPAAARPPRRRSPP